MGVKLDNFKTNNEYFYLSLSSDEHQKFHLDKIKGNKNGCM